MAWDSEKKFQALALTGGGYRGLFTARALQVIEEHTKEPIGRKFDLISGTSIGGVIALAIAFEIPMKVVVDAFIEFGEEIFPPRHRPKTSAGKLIELIRYSKKPRYQSTALKNVIGKILNKDAILGDAKHALAIPAVNVTMGHPQIFKTRHKKEWTRDWKIRAIDIALATSAAPTYFELAEVNGNLYADGGLYANAPDLIVAHEAQHFFSVPDHLLRILSIGTTTQSYSVSFSSGRGYGIADWMDDARLFSVTISSQQQLIDQLMKHKLNDAYFRLDCDASHEISQDFGLDVASETAKRGLIGLADKVTSDHLGSDISKFLDHKPQNHIFREA